MSYESCDVDLDVDRQ